MQGLFLCNKPSGPSSAQFLNEFKRTLHIPREVRVGHGGTLDPFAEGLLVVGVSRAYTKQLNQPLLHETKEYETEILLGASSDTDDKTGKISPAHILHMEQFANSRELANKKIRDAIRELQKREEQAPPIYSAIKLEGKAAYKRARAGEDFSLKNKKVKLLDYEIKKIETKDNLIILEINMLVSAGFYIRSFARDLGQLLDIGGYVQALKRVKIGDFSLKNALNLDDFDKTMTLYVREPDGAKNGSFSELIKPARSGLKIETKSEGGILTIRGKLNDLQIVLEQINNYAKEHDILIQNWFGK